MGGCDACRCWLPRRGALPPALWRSDRRALLHRLSGDATAVFLASRPHCHCHPRSFLVFTFQTPGEEKWAIKTTHKAGDLGFDPLGFKPTTEAELKEMQTKELNNGRLAMIAIAGM